MFNKESRMIFKEKINGKWKAWDPEMLLSKIKISYPKASSFFRDSKISLIEVRGPKTDDKGNIVEFDYQPTDFELSTLEQQHEVLERMVQFSRTAFGLTKDLVLDDEGEIVDGISDSEALGLFMKFMLWVDEVKKNTEPVSNLPEPMESTSCDSETIPLPTN